MLMSSVMRTEPMEAGIVLEDFPYRERLLPKDGPIHALAVGRRRGSRCGRCDGLANGDLRDFTTQLSEPLGHWQPLLGFGQLDRPT